MIAFKTVSIFHNGNRVIAVLVFLIWHQKSFSLLISLTPSHPCFREINKEGVIYEGGFNMGLKQGKGEMHYEDGTAEKGRWTKGNKLGHFECNDSNGNLIQKKTYGYGREIRKEEVLETIYKEK